MATTTPYSSPNWAKRMMRLNTPKVPKGPDENDPTQAALGLFNRGMRAGADGSLQPTQDFGGLLQKSSQQINGLTRGIKGGAMSSLGKPMNSMYEQNPGFFNRGGNAGGVEGFGQMLAQTREQRIAQSQQDGTFGTIRDKFNLDNQGSGTQMNEFGNMVKNAGTPKAAPSATGNRPVDNALIEKRGFDSPVEKEPAMGSRLSDMMGDMGRRSGSAEPAIVQRSVTTPAPTGTSAPTPQMSSQQLSNRKALEDAVAGKKLLQETQKPFMQIDRQAGGGEDTLIQGQYGKGFAAKLPAGTKRPPGEEGLIDGRPFSEVMQGLANKPGLARKEDKFQPQKWGDALKRAKTK